MFKHLLSFYVDLNAQVALSEDYYANDFAITKGLCLKLWVIGHQSPRFTILNQPLNSCFA
ncbi:hypothetical protein BAE29_02335 [Acidithiobacillus caldus]|uniref:Uncharacterized protein n=1 Tax=Acidithiobacillus caldus TaxID=33059 RepID=A0A1E7YQ71_9PROT|nr:hypothetical protein BAE28_10025 [Acidithiobacillus caldus]OFC38327.1 hypothetical protein BAE27_02215 [Acidithiobacillus caldus]OFC41544.1 hypothetical protein BAE29_02335 [Acidithiobacillus caldus]OFC44256.1 hypothetical protein BAE30_14255 [Acidithiobacillus caldus]